MPHHSPRQWAVLAVLSIVPAAAQFNSSIQGVVTDPSSATVPGVSVKVTNLQTGVTRDAETSAEGFYRILSLGAGVYRVETSKAGFRGARRDRVEVGISEAARVDFELAIGTVTENVTVEATPVAVETEQGRISGRIDRAQLNDIPLAGRNLYNLIALQPGIIGRGISSSITAGGAGNDSFSGELAPPAYASGQRTESNSFTVDDSSVNSAARGGITNLTPSADSVEEVRIVANNFSAVDGRNSGAQIQVLTKSGTNTFHGSVSEYFNNNTLSARTIFETSIPVFRRNQYGYTIGGPIVKNRTFFFHSFEGLRQSGARPGFATVETPEFRDWVIRTRPNSIAAKILRDLAPIANPTFNFRDAGAPRAGQVAPPSGLMALGTAQFLPESWRKGAQHAVRIDHELWPGKDRLFGNLYRTTSSSLGGGIRPIFNRPTDELTYFGSLNHTHTFGPNMLNEARAGIMRLQGIPRVPERLDIPAISITGSTGFGTNFFPAGWFQTNFNYKNVFSWIRGGHTWKMGGEFRTVRSNSYNTNNYIPSYNFINLLDFAYDDPLSVVRKVDPRTGRPGTNVVGLRGKEYSLFFNDDWKVSRNLTFNVGLRYENYGSPTEVNGLLRNLVFGGGNNYFERLATGKVDFVKSFFPTDNNDFAPRFGFAWNPDGKGRTAIRGGYGIAHDRLFMTPLLNFRDNPPLRADATLGRNFGTTAVFALGDVSKPDFGYPLDPALALGLDDRNGIRGARVSIIAVDPNLRTSYVQNWFFGIQRGLGWGVVVEGNYLGTAGRKLYNQANTNRYSGDLALDNRFNGWNPSFSGVSIIESSSSSIHHGGTFQVRKTFSTGLVMQAAYTYGKTIADSNDLVSGTAYQDIANRRLDRAVTSYDVPKKLAYVAIYDLPFLKGSRNLAGHLLGGWQISTTGIFQAGNPFTVFSSASWPRGDFNADGLSNDRVNAPANTLRRKGWSKQELLSGIFTAADFPLPAPGTNGNLGRNTFRQPGYAQVDASMSKKFVITERVSAQLRVDVFNAVNRVNLGGPNTDLVSNNFGKVLGTASPRSLQLGLRLAF